MGFMDRIRNSWELVKLSWHLLMQDKELLVFPVLSTLGALALFIGIVLPFGIADGVNYFVLFLWYLGASFVTIYFNAALFACVKKRLQGGDPTISYGVKEASKRIAPIFIWSLVTASVGLLLRALEELADDNFLAQMVIGILGAAWSLMTMFVIPVLVIEGVGVGSAMKRSVNLVKKTWGENLIADVSIGLGFLGLYILGIVVYFVTVSLNPALQTPMLILGVLYILVLAVLQSTLSMVFDAVLYSYATGDNVPLEFKRIAGEAFHKR